MAHYDTLNLD